MKVDECINWFAISEDDLEVVVNPECVLEKFGEMLELDFEEIEELRDRYLKAAFKGECDVIVLDAYMLYKVTIFESLDNDFESIVFTSGTILNRAYRVPYDIGDVVNLLTPTIKYQDKMFQVVVDETDVLTLRSLGDYDINGFKIEMGEWYSKYHNERIFYEILRDMYEHRDEIEVFLG